MKKKKVTSRARYSREFKLNAVRGAKNGFSYKEVGRNLGVSERLVGKWVREYNDLGPEHAFPGRGRREKRILGINNPEVQKKIVKQENPLDSLMEQIVALKAERDQLRGFISDLEGNLKG